MNELLIALSIAEACKATGLGRSTVFNAIREGKLRAVKLGNRTLVRAEDLRAFVDSLPVIGKKVA